MAVNDETDRAEAAGPASEPGAEKPAGEAKGIASSVDAPASSAGASGPGRAAHDAGGAPEARARRAPASPFWIAPVYLGGLVLVYVGERVLGDSASWHWPFTGLGLALVVAATAARFSPRFRLGRRGELERWLPFLAVLGLLALGLYFATTDWGMATFGLSGLESSARERWLGILQVSWVVLLAVAVVPTLFAEAALHPMRHAERPEHRRVHAAMASGLAVVLAAIYCALLVFAADGVDWKVDYSYFKTSEPSESTRNVARSLTDPVKVTAFFPQVSEVKNEVERYLSELARGNPKLQVEVRDRLLLPKLARDLRVTQDGVIVLSRGTTNERLDIGVELDAARPKLKTLDRDFQEKLMKLARSRRGAYLTVGHGELNDVARAAEAEAEGRSARVVRLLLEKQNYQVKDLGLAQGLGSEVPEDASIVMVLGPTEPFAPEELAALDRYAQRGGHLLFALDPDAVSRNTATVVGAADPAGALVDGGAAPTSDADAGTAPPSAAPPSGAGAGTLATLQALSAMVGLTYSPDVLANDRQHLRRRYNDSDRTILMTNRYSSHASVSTLSRNSARAATVVLGAGSLESGKDKAGKTDFVLRSMPATFADANRNYQPDSAEKKTTFNLAAAVTRPVTAASGGANAGARKDEKGKTGPEEMRAFVLADADALSDVALSNAMYNQLLLVDAVRWLGGEESFAGAVNNEEDVRIEHTKQADLVWFYATIFGAPALVLGAGLIYSRHSRKARGGRR